MSPDSGCGMSVVSGDALAVGVVFREVLKVGVAFLMRSINVGVASR